jgi:hypothetical protein
VPATKACNVNIIADLFFFMDYGLQFRTNSIKE